MSTGDTTNNEVVVEPGNELFNDCPVTDKQDTLVVDQGVAATGEVTLTDNQGNPVDFSKYFDIDCSDAYRYQTGNWVGTPFILVSPEDEEKYQTGDFIPEPHVKPKDP